MSLLHHIKQTFIAMDQLGNAMLLGGWADESISARAWRQSDQSWMWIALRRAIDLVFFWSPNHCQSSYTSEMQRHELPRAYRNAMDNPVIQTDATEK